MSPKTKRRSRTLKPDLAPDHETRRLLVNSALTLFEKSGYPGTTVEEIVEVAGLTKGAFYHHFESKEEVLEIIHNDYVDSQISLCSQIIARTDNPTEQLRQVARETIIGLSNFRSHMSVYLQDRRFLTGSRRENVAARRKEVDRLFTGIIKRGIASGEFRDDIEAKLVAFGLIGMYAWVINWWRPGGPMTIDQVADQYIELILDGLSR